MIGTGTEREGLYYYDTVRTVGCNSVSAVVPSSSLLWHQRMLALSLSKNMKFCDIDDCLVCPLAKQTHRLFPLSSFNSLVPFELIHVDIWGGYHIPSIIKAQYFLTIVDDYSRCTWVYLMHHKSDARQKLTTFINLVEAQFSSQVKIVRSDNAPALMLPMPALALPTLDLEFPAPGLESPHAAPPLTLAPVFQPPLRRTTTRPSYLQQYHINIKLPSMSLPSSNSVASLSAVKEPIYFVQVAHNP
ncbi:unnamed protein product [Prunus brigantina]